MMKQCFLSLVLMLALSGCSKNQPNANCGYLVNAGVDFTINLSLPQFSSLQFPSNSVYVSNQGNGGVIVTNNGSGLIAWDAADPNHIFSQCSIMSIVGGITAKCNCEEGNEYSLITGQSIGQSLPCALRSYRVEQTGQNTFLVTD